MKKSYYAIKYTSFYEEINYDRSNVDTGVEGGEGVGDYPGIVTKSIKNVS